MWIAKGTLLGLWLAGFGTLALLYFAVYRHLPRNSAVDYRLITRFTTADPFWWVALAGCLAIGYIITRIWAGPLGIWIGLAITGLIPLGFLTMFITLVMKLKQVSAAR
jgi:hypothetical protein